MAAKQGKRCTFDEWLKYLFDHDAASLKQYLTSLDRTYWCDISSTKTVTYITQAFESAQTVFAVFSNAQLNQGFWYLISSSSDIMRVLLDNQVTWANRQRCILAFNTVFEQLFAKRCSPYLSHLNEPRDNPLNSVCYMWWDIFPFWGQFVSNPKIDDLFLDVMVSTLKLNSDPCQESALHGLGHFPVQRDVVHSEIDRFLADNPNIRPELREYALRAQAGGVQ